MNHGVAGVPVNAVICSWCVNPCHSEEYSDGTNKLLARCAEKLVILEVHVLQVVCELTLSTWLAIVNNRLRTLPEK